MEILTQVPQLGNHEKTKKPINPMPAAALKYALLGWFVVPLHTPIFDNGKLTGCSCEAYRRGEQNRIRLEMAGRGNKFDPNYRCPTPGKHPQLSDWETKASNDPAQIAKWWRKWPWANIGIAAGKSGLFDLDFDTYKDFFEGADLLTPAEQKTTTNLSGAGGEHLIYQMPEGKHYSNATGDLPQGLDVRGFGGQFVAPPSLHKSGNRYEWEEGFSPWERAPQPLPEKLIARLDAAQPTATAAPVVFSGIEQAKPDLTSWPISHEIRALILKPPPQGERSEADYRVCLSFVYAGATDDEILSVFQHYPIGTEGKTAEAGDGYLARTIRKARQFAEANPRPTLADDQPIHNTDWGNAKRMVKQFGVDLHYVYAWSKWFIWNGRRWAEDKTGEIERVAKRTVAGIYAEAAQASSKDDRANLAKWALSSEAQGKISAMIAMAQSELGIPVEHEELDGDPMLLNCKNGTIDLRTGKLLPHDRKHLATKQIDIDFDPDAKCPLWQRFLQRIMAENQELIGFLQRALGYSLTGSVVEQCLFFLYGTGSNGKTTFVEIAQSLLGDYAQKAPTEMIMIKQNTGGIPNDIARLPGARFVVTSEIEAGRRLAESLVKDLTGGDKQVARFMRQEYFEFNPTHKLWIYGNHKPVIKGSDNGIWRRIHLVPFEVQIPDPEKDERLKEKLQAELPGILAWAVRGCLEWQRGGLRAPVEVKTATAAYRAESDAFSNFIDECCVEGINLSCRFDQLYAAYKVWAERNGERTEGSRQFGNTLTERGYLAEKGTAGARMRRGIGLIETKSEVNK